MLRATFLRRMALAAAACAFIDVPWPKAQGPTATELRAALDAMVAAMPKSGNLEWVMHPDVAAKLDEMGVALPVTLARGRAML